MDPLLQKAESRKYDSSLVWHIAEIEGTFVLYDYERRPVYIGGDWNELLEVYRNRPKYVPRPKLELAKIGIDLSKLEIRI